MNDYAQQGYANRREYLKAMAEDYGVPLDVVMAVAGILGPNEDFDGLVSQLEDIAESGEYD